MACGKPKCVEKRAQIAAQAKALEASKPQHPATQKSNFRTPSTNVFPKPVRKTK